VQLTRIASTVQSAYSGKTEQLEVTRPASSEHKPLGLVWIDCPYPVVAAGLKSALEGQARVHLGPMPPADDVPSSVIFDTGGVEGLSEGIKRMQGVNPAISILIFSLHVNLPLARAALRLGARGFIHAGMEPEQIARAVEVAGKGEIVAPRKLLEFLIANEDPAGLDALTPRQQDTLELVAQGLSNAQIAKRLFLSESTVKQHLRAAYKVLGVKDRKEASKLIGSY
jgi:DNA-binding NarL/FixJ family response regulator